ncbi:MAG: hypothetical protein Q7U73_18245 [Rubrivivax sp.]|nr:hypothetical protein [Rubrivivax sp.]
MNQLAPAQASPTAVPIAAPSAVPPAAPPWARRTPIDGARHDDPLSTVMLHGTVPTSFAVFEPVGGVMIGLPGAGPAEAAVLALHQAGWSAAALQRFSPRESVDALEALVDSAGALAGYGDEVALLRRYLALSRQGCRWLLVKVSGIEHAATAAEVARRCGALMAVHYRLLTVDELL